MAALIALHDWSATSLGAAESWSPALKLIVDIICASGFPMALRWGPDLTLVYNDGYKHILADKHPWALGRPFREAWPEVQSELLPVHEDILSGRSPGVFSEDRPLTIQRRGSSWETGYFTVCYSPVPDETSPTGVGGVLVTAAEATDRKRAEDALRHLNLTLQAQVAERARERDEIWRVSQDMLLVIDRNGVVRAVNPAWTRTLGYAAEELIGRSIEAFIEPGDVDRSHAAIDRAAREALPSFENRYRHKDGSWRHLSWTAAPSGELIYCVARDVTDEKRRERELAEAHAHLKQAQKMEAIGQLTGGVAHDFNNLLQVISGNLELLANDTVGNQRAERHVANARSAVNRGAKLASQLLAFGRRQALEPRVVNIGRLVANMGDLLRRALGEAVEIETIGADGLWNTMIDPANLENAIVNLAINARDAMGGAGKLTIETGNVSLDDVYARMHGDVTPGQYVMLAVTDTGCGMTPEVADQAFDPFFSTKPEGQGTGLGLSMVYGFVKQSRGHIKIYSEVGLGTSVKLYLPRNARQEDAIIVVDPKVETGGTETILVVEDDDQVRATAIEMLGDLGYRVLSARDAASALSAIEQGHAIDLLFTDVVMPGDMRSPELARKAQERLPDIAVLFTSGYTENSIVHGGRLDPGVDLLAKPYTREALAGKIRQALKRDKNKSSTPSPGA
ncbi:PAS domain S-box protein [Bradyrhizobium sp.]|uniref:hybrid sensor histidine kinase/response regulator n=1 Tax=Bradyrhizobium sp. TaxID=376 RepID=UPI003C5303F7